jgi:hypothetical protein
MDYCNEMGDIDFGLRNGPKFCPHCESALDAKGHTHVAELALRARRLISKRKDKLIGKRMELRDERSAKTDDRDSYDVALSFAGEDRPNAHALAAALENSGIRVFYMTLRKVNCGAKTYTHICQISTVSAPSTALCFCREITHENYGPITKERRRKSAHSKTTGLIYYR